MNGSMFCHPNKSGDDLHLIVADLRRSLRDQTLILLPPTRKIYFLVVAFSQMRNGAIDISMKHRMKILRMYKDVGKSA